MKLVRLFAAAGLMMSTLGMSTVADAQDRGPRYEHRDDRGRDDRGRGYDRRDDRGRGHARADRRHDNGNHYGQRGRGHQRCYTQWRNHRQVRICR